MLVGALRQTACTWLLPPEVPCGETRWLSPDEVADFRRGWPEHCRGGEYRLLPNGNCCSSILRQIPMPVKAVRACFLPPTGVNLGTCAPLEMRSSVHCIERERKGHSLPKEHPVSYRPHCSHNLHGGERLEQRQVQNPLRAGEAEPGDTLWQLGNWRWAHAGPWALAASLPSGGSA